MKRLIFLAMLLSSIPIFGQKGYAKDSLQIKVYANILFKNKQAVDIKVRKVFCDFCSEKQIKYFEEDGLRRAYLERYLPENRLVNGVRKLTILIRIAKEDFKNMNN